eukprot:TRINITY_DN14879_c0_g3_i1.p1 TRINITY_DN14879_c0_g3~~TRINITY_DN14879_c0_g3_i1.p1  ORF type:complete len:526 (+),score=118.93 TRINITY_DN14879_c0_g3_i1:226-1578(+)
MGAASLAEGAFGAVRLATCRKSGACVILKSVFDYTPDKFALEVDLQAECDHPNIARIHECFELPSKHQAYIVLQSCGGGEVLDFLDGREGAAELDALMIFKQMMRGVTYMHNQGIAHRDLKPRNLMLQEKGLSLAENTIKIIDFGFAQRFQPGVDSLKTKCGSPNYTAPEILKRPYNEKCDIWSCGVILYLLLTQCLPFDADETEDILANAARGKLCFDGPEWQGRSKTAILLVVQMVHLDTNKRITGAKALASPWCSQHAKDVPSTKVCLTSDCLRHNFTKYRNANSFMRSTLLLVARHVDDAATKKLRETFTAMDKDMSGRLSAAEIMESCEDLDISKGTLEQIVQELDVNGEGGINYSEFLAMHLKTSEHLQRGAIWEAFVHFDSNGDGQISAEELESVLGDLGRGSNDTVQNMLREADTDGDGEISFEEFDAMVRRYASTITRELR